MKCIAVTYRWSINFILLMCIYIFYAFFHGPKLYTHSDLCACFCSSPGQRKWFGMDQATKATGKQTTTAKRGGPATVL